MTAKPDIEALSKEFCELAGICWHELMSVQDGIICTKCHRYSYDISNGGNPDYSSDPIAVLIVMQKRDDWEDFIEWLTHRDTDPLPEWFENYLLTSGAMLEKAVEFMEGGRDEL